MEEHIRAFIGYLKDVKGMSGNTALSLHEYVRFLEAGGFKAATISRNIASVRAFCHYLAGEGIVNAAVADNLKAPRVEKRAPDVLNEEVERLLEQPGRDKPIHLRDRAMLELLYSTKIRVSELIALNMQDVNMEMSYIICHDIKKDRAIPFGERAGKALEEYVENARGKLLKDEKEQAFFVNCSGSGMSRQGFWKLLKNYARAAQITKEITPQIFRYSVTDSVLPGRR